MYQQSDAGAVEKLRKVSCTVWVGLKGMIIEKTLKEK
jgi:hypothetical protein|tara:strand:+ start:192 stop:302 length:111 start_codon:yes stop_codon:yes gene_type:complete